MSRVRILPEILSNKIAAGEVVERPASAVKELVENSLDAGSTMIAIDIENGGRTLIRVSDNGSGMAKDDAMLAVERYATSKLKNDDDLFAISTLGFRGEALPSIASVSRFKIETRPRGSDSGVLIAIEGGHVKKVEEAGAPEGTMVTVEQLFFNTPARRKFLKTINTEMGHIAETIASIALGWPNVMFRLSHNGKILKSWPGTGSTYERAVDVLGRELNKKLHEIHHSDPYLEIRGLVSSPDVTRSTSQKIYLFVNGRFIRDRGIIHALFDGYGSRLMKGRYPIAILFITLPFDQIDVNVHPTKHEIRFVDRKKVFEPLKHCVNAALAKSEQSKWSEVPVREQEPQEISLVPEIPAAKTEQRRAAPRIKQEQPVQYTSESVAGIKSDKGCKASLPLQTAVSDNVAVFSVSDSEPVKSPPAQEEFWDKRFFSDLTVIGQLRNSYILCDSKEGLIIIDQHAAHERIVYESLKKRGVRKSSQALLMPETIELGYKESAAFVTILPELAELGLEIEPFGGTTFVIKSVPTLLSDQALHSLVTEIAEKMVDIEKSDAVEKAIDECLILMSCHGAIRAKAKLEGEQIRHLLKQLDEIDNSSCCPHGRPTWVKWSMGFIEKAFKRVV